ncbi:MAG TPA: GspH/FimT family pseudopilin [Propylenella sp.]|nr:GspH/FimT family pseudopilin [Propylenella sp.]
MLALAIFGLVAAVVFPRVVRGPGPVELATAAQEIAALLRSDRNAALRHGREIVSRIDPAQRAVISGSSGAGVAVPAGIEIVFVQSSRELRGNAGGIRFLPGGGSSGGFLSLKRGTAGYDISVNWLTGGVLLAQAAAPATP